MANIKKTASKPVVEKEEPVVEKKEVFGEITDCELLNLRKKASVDGEVIKQLKVDTKLLILNPETKSAWFNVVVDDSKGYVMKKYIKVIE